MSGENKEDTLDVSPEALLEVIEEGAIIYSHITEEFIKNFQFYGKTLYEWSQELSIDIPEAGSLDEKGFRKLLLELASNTQKANNYYSASSLIVNTIDGGNSIKKADVVNAIVAGYEFKGRKRPAASMIETMAESYMSSTVSARVAAKIVKNFWRQRVDTLLELRKIFEQIGMSLHVEIKFTSS